MAPSGGLELEVGPGAVRLVVGQAGADEVQRGAFPRVLRGRDRGPVRRHHGLGGPGVVRALPAGIATAMSSGPGG